MQRARHSEGQDGDARGPGEGLTRLVGIERTYAGTASFGRWPRLPGIPVTDEAGGSGEAWRFPT